MNEILDSKMPNGASYNHQQRQRDAGSARSPVASVMWHYRGFQKLGLEVLPLPSSQHQQVPLRFLSVTLLLFLDLVTISDELYSRRV